MNNAKDERRVHTTSPSCPPPIHHQDRREQQHVLFQAKERSKGLGRGGARGEGGDEGLVRQLSPMVFLPRFRRGLRANPTSNRPLWTGS